MRQPTQLTQNQHVKRKDYKDLRTKVYIPKLFKEHIRKLHVAH